MVVVGSAGKTAAMWIFDVVVVMVERTGPLWLMVVDDTRTLRRSDFCITIKSGHGSGEFVGLSCGWRRVVHWSNQPKGNQMGNGKDKTRKIYGKTKDASQGDAVYGGMEDDGRKTLADLVHKTPDEQHGRTEFPEELFKDDQSIYHPVGPDATQFIDLAKVDELREHGGPVDPLEFPGDPLPCESRHETLKFPGDPLPYESRHEALKFPDYDTDGQD